MSITENLPPEYIAQQAALMIRFGSTNESYLFVQYILSTEKVTALDD